MESDTNQGVLKSETFHREPSPPHKVLPDSEETRARASCKAQVTSSGRLRQKSGLGRARLATTVKCTCTSQRQGDRPGSPVGAQELTGGFVHGICLLGGKSDVGHFPSREKNNNTRKRRALWECSKWEFQLSPEHKQRGATSLEVRPGGH